jgi:hypothetical protein
MKKSWFLMTMAALLMMLFGIGCGKDKGAEKASMPREFSATMVSASAGQKVTMQVYIKPDIYRTDVKKAGSSTIVRKDLNKAWMIMTAEKTYMEMPGMATDAPHQMAEEQVKGEVSRKKVGSETVDGHPATKYEITAKADDKVMQIYQWWATDINFPVKTAAVDGSWSMEYRDIKIGDQPDSLFEVPSGYKKMSIPGMPAGMNIKIPGMGAK